MRVPDDVFAQICAEMEAAERSGELDGIFKREPRAPDQQTGRKSFLHSFSIGMKLYKSTFLKIYGYAITTPGFAEDALTWLEFLGCSKAREYYRAVLLEWEHEHNKEMKSAAHWYKGQCENEWENMKRKAVRESRRQQEAEQLKTDLQQKSDRELLILLQRLRQSGT